MILYQLSHQGSPPCPQGNMKFMPLIFSFWSPRDQHIVLNKTESHVYQLTDSCFRKMMFRWPYLVTAWWSPPSTDTNQTTPFRGSQRWGLMCCTQGNWGDWIFHRFHRSACSITSGLEMDLLTTKQHQSRMPKQHHKASVLSPNTALRSPSRNCFRTVD